MESQLQIARDDLAFLRGLVSDGGTMQRGIGQAFTWAGGLYGGECALHCLQALGRLPTTGPLAVAVVVVPSAVFLFVLGLIFWRDRRKKATGVGARALVAVFQGAGWANLVLAFVFGFGARSAHSLTVWFYHPIVACLFQAVAWYVAWVILRRRWLGLVSAGWFVTSAALGAVVGSSAALLAVLAVALPLLMGLPGYILMSQAGQPSRAET